MSTCRLVSRCSIFSVLAAFAATFGLPAESAWSQQTKKVPVISVLARHTARSDLNRGQPQMAIKRCDIEAACKNLPTLLERATRGQPSVVTKHGRAWAAIVPVHYLRYGQGPSILSLRGTGKGLWGGGAGRSIRALRAGCD